ncbi:MAG: SAM-dependent methyltransferase [Sphingomicrobium sp.]
MAACNAYYYATRDPLGASGDFTTAPEISQMFGELIGAALTDCWLRAGAPTDAIYAELGPGRGSLAADALRVMRGGGFSGEVHFIETSPILRTAQAKAVPGAIFHDRLTDLPPRQLLLVANEFLDALPIEQWVGVEQRRVVLVDGELRLTPKGEVREATPARDAEVVALAAHLVANGGAALIIDYGYRQSAPGDSLQAVRAQAFADPLANPGEHDLTAHVDFGAVASAATAVGASVTPVVAQATFLERLGIAARAMALAAKNPAQGEAVVAARRRLCDASEMGELFKVIAVHAPGWPEPAGFRG